MATVTTDVVREFKDLDLNFNIHPVKKDINRNLGPRSEEHTSELQSH